MWNWLRTSVSRRHSGRVKTHRRFAFEQLESRRVLATFVVNSTYDGANAATTPGTLRYAITQANLNSAFNDGDEIKITFPNGTPQVISLNSALPTITGYTTIWVANATSYPGVEIRPAINSQTQLPVFAGSGITIGSASGTNYVAITGAAIGGFQGDGITVLSTDESLVQLDYCWLGLDLNGNPHGNSGNGISFGGSSDGSSIENCVISSNSLAAHRN